MSNAVAALKRVELAGLHEGWTEEAFALVRPANYDDMQELDKLRTDNKSPAEQVEWQIAFTRKHFYSGKIPRFVDDKIVVDDMTSDDVDATVALADELFAAIIGIDVDPKALRATAANGSEPSAEEVSTETPSSTASQEQPQPKQ